MNTLKIHYRYRDEIVHDVKSLEHAAELFAASALLALLGAGARVTATTHADRDIIWCEGLDDLVAPVGALVSDILQHRLENLVYTRRECRFWDDGKHCTNVTDIARELCPEHLPPGRDVAVLLNAHAELDALVGQAKRLLPE